MRGADIELWGRRATRYGLTDASLPPAEFPAACLLESRCRMHTANIQVRSVVAWAARSPHVPARDRAETVALARSLLATDRSWLRDRGFVGTVGRVLLPRSAHLGSGEAGA